jgi:hypothetical protein
MGEDPWRAMEHCRHPYVSFKGCALRPAPVSEPYADLANTARCVCQSVAHLINDAYDIVIRGLYAVDQTTGRWYSIPYLEICSMQDEATYCLEYDPRSF